MPKKGYKQTEEHRLKSVAHGMKFKLIGHTEEEKERMRQRAQTWSKEDEQYLAIHWVNNTPWHILFEVLKRRTGAIRDKARRMKLSRRRNLRRDANIFTSPIDGMCYSVRSSGGGYLTTSINHKHLKIHRIEMEKIIGRCLLPNERVHHKNGNKRDNRRENLMLFDHTIRHAHIDTDRAEKAENYIKTCGLWEDFSGDNA